jgi:hypothetical protein
VAAAREALKEARRVHESFATEVKARRKARTEAARARKVAAPRLKAAEQRQRKAERAAAAKAARAAKEAERMATVASATATWEEAAQMVADLEAKCTAATAHAQELAAQLAANRKLRASQAPSLQQALQEQVSLHRAAVANLEAYKNEVAEAAAARAASGVVESPEEEAARVAVETAKLAELEEAITAAAANEKAAEAAWNELQDADARDAAALKNAAEAAGALSTELRAAEVKWFEAQTAEYAALGMSSQDLEVAAQEKKSAEAASKEAFSKKLDRASHSERSCKREVARLARLRDECAAKHHQSKADVEAHRKVRAAAELKHANSVAQHALKMDDKRKRLEMYGATLAAARRHEERARAAAAARGEPWPEETEAEKLANEELRKSQDEKLVKMAENIEAEDRDGLASLEASKSFPVSEAAHVDVALLAAAEEALVKIADALKAAEGKWSEAQSAVETLTQELKVEEELKQKQPESAEKRYRRLKAAKARAPDPSLSPSSSSSSSASSSASTVAPMQPGFAATFMPSITGFDDDSSSGGGLEASSFFDDSSSVDTSNFFTGVGLFTDSLMSDPGEGAPPSPSPLFGGMSMSSVASPAAPNSTVAGPQKSEATTSTLFAENSARMASRGPPPGYPINFFERFEGAQRAVKLSKNAFGSLLPGEPGAEQRVKAVGALLRALAREDASHFERLGFNSSTMSSSSGGALNNLAPLGTSSVETFTTTAPLSEMGQLQIEQQEEDGEEDNYNPPLLSAAAMSELSKERRECSKMVANLSAQAESLSAAAEKAARKQAAVEAELQALLLDTNDSQQNTVEGLKEEEKGSNDSALPSYDFAASYSASHALHQQLVELKQQRSGSDDLGAEAEALEAQLVALEDARTSATQQLQDALNDALSALTAAEAATRAEHDAEKQALETAEKVKAREKAAQRDARVRQRRAEVSQAQAKAQVQKDRQALTDKFENQAKARSFQAPEEAEMKAKREAEEASAMAALDAQEAQIPIDAKALAESESRRADDEARDFATELQQASDTAAQAVSNRESAIAEAAEHTARMAKLKRALKVAALMAEKFRLRQTAETAAANAAATSQALLEKRDALATQGAALELQKALAADAQAESQYRMKRSERRQEASEYAKGNKLGTLRRTPPSGRSNHVTTAMNDAPRFSRSAPASAFVEESSSSSLVLPAINEQRLGTAASVSVAKDWDSQQQQRASTLLAENSARMASRGPPPGYPVHFFERFEGAQRAVKAGKVAFGSLLPGEAGVEQRAKAIASGLKTKHKQKAESSPEGRRDRRKSTRKNDLKLPKL